jgi:hypothetical protein
MPAHRRKRKEQTARDAKERKDRQKRPKKRDAKKGGGRRIIVRLHLHSCGFVRLKPRGLASRGANIG